MLSLEIVNECNLNCDYCYLGQKKHTKMSRNIAIAAVNMAIHEAKKQKDKHLHVYFLGGEPLLEIEFIKNLLLYIQDICAQNNLSSSYSITTNGTLITSPIADFLIKNKFEIKISIDGTQAAHDKNRKYFSGEGSYDSIMVNLRKLKNYNDATGKQIRIAQVITTNNVNNFSESFIYLISLGFKIIETSLNNFEKWDSVNLSVLSSEIESAFTYYCRLKLDGSNVYWRLAENYIKNYFSEVPFYACKAGLKSIFVNVEGNYYPCKEVDGAMKIGQYDKNLNVDAIRKLIYLDETQNPICLKCIYLKNCIVRGCIADNYTHNSDIYKPVEVECYLTKLFFGLIDQYIPEAQISIFKKIYNRGELNER